MIRLRRRGLAITSAAVLTAGIFGVAPMTHAGAAAGTPFSQAAFFSYGTGSQIHTDAITSGGSSVLAVEQAFSGVTAANNPPLSRALNDTVTGALVQPASAIGFNAYGRGTGLEVGLGTQSAAANQILLPGLAEAKSPPPQAVGPLHLLPLNIPGITNGAVLNGLAASNFNGTFCPIGEPLALGEGDASNVGLLGTLPGNSLVTTAGTGPPAPTGLTPPTATGFSTSFTQLVANPVIPGVSVADGTFGLVSTVQEHIAPVSVNLVPGVTALEISVNGSTPNAPITLTTAVDGQGHTATTLADSDTLVVDIANTVLGVTTRIPIVSINLNTILAPGGLVVDTDSIPLLGGPGGILTLLNTRIRLAIAAPPVPIASFGANTASSASATFDLVALNVTVAGVKLVGLNIGHMQTAVALAGSIACTIPVAKNANPTNVTAGSSFTWNILIPSTSTALNNSMCDLTNITATDVIGVAPGSPGKPTFTITSISNGGTYNPTTHTVTWGNLGNYHPGDPPKMLTVTVAVPSTSPAGVLQDIANASAGLGNCSGSATGTANLSNAVLTGSFTLNQPAVAANNGGGLPATGTGPTLAWAGALLLIMAEGTRRILRRARPRPLT